MKDLIKDYLAHSYLYYCLDSTVITDHAFDKLCEEINQTWDVLESDYKGVIEAHEYPPIKGLQLDALGYPKEIREYAIDMMADKEAERELFKNG
jgi:hypothetical protein